MVKITERVLEINIAISFFLFKCVHVSFVNWLLSADTILCSVGLGYRSHVTVSTVIYM